MSENSHPELADERALLGAFFEQFPFFQHHGFELLEVEPGRSVIRMSHREDLCQPAGILHGGTIAALCDTGMAHAILLTEFNRRLRNSGGSIVSLDLRVKYFRPVRTGLITAVSTAPRVGSRIVHTESLVTNEEGKEIAKADAIFMGVEGLPIGGR